MRIFIITLFIQILLTQTYCSNIHSDILENYHNKPTKDVFKAWHYANQKPYDYNSEEGLNRYRVFKKNLEFIKKTNAENEDFKLGLGPFTDMTFEEFKLGASKPDDTDDYLNKHVKGDVSKDRFFNDKIDPSWLEGLPDWTDQVKVKRARLQYSYKFGYIKCFTEYLYNVVAATFEAHIKIRLNEDVELSTQNMFDCSYYGDETGNIKCDINSSPYIYAFSNLEFSGLYKVENYPMLKRPEMDQGCKEFEPFELPYDYTSQTDKCSALSAPCTLSQKREMLLRGPVMSTINVNERIQHYKSGIFKANTCRQKDFYTPAILTHISKKVAKAKTAFGETWGENGAITISREFSQEYVLGTKRWTKTCGLEDEMVSPDKRFRKLSH